MQRSDVNIAATGGGEFDCYMVAPDGDRKVPAIVLASAIHGVTAELRAIADELASNGYLAFAPDLFWRTVPGPLSRDDPRTTGRGQPRLEVIKQGEADMVDTLALAKSHALCNGRVAAIGFCFGGPYAVLGPARLGYDAGISCHGTQMLDYIGALYGLRKPVCIIWGDQDHAAPTPVLEAYRQATDRMSNADLHVFPGVLHGYMFRDNPKAFDAKTYAFSLGKALAILEELRVPAQA
jgi:carboxymethylenebutenolidase